MILAKQEKRNSGIPVDNHFVDITEMVQGMLKHQPYEFPF
jgi:hypothetical protein